ncbi:MAG TPA: hypothetical protein VFH21_01785 [Burkholderiales bacterium]|nr:hypothetical protein [Burkholderiales bacterium]
MSERKLAYGEQHEVDPRIFSGVYSHIAQHRGTADTGVLLDLISAISLNRSACYFETLERLEPSTRDLGLELLKAKLYGAFPPEAWEDAHQFAKQLNQPTNDQVSTQNSIVREPINEQHPLTSRVARDPKREARQSAESFGIGSTSAATGARGPAAATTVKSADFETQSEPRARRRFRHGARTALAYTSQYGGFDGFKYLWGAAAAAAVIGLFVLVVALDERVLDRRFETFASWFSEPVESPPQIQRPVLAEVDTTVAPAPEVPAKTEPEGLSEQYNSSLPAAGQEPVIEEATSVEDAKIAIAPPLASANESGVPEDSSLAQDVPLAPPSQEPVVEQAAPAVIASKPPKPTQRAVPKKAKSDSKVRSKPAKPSLAKRPVRPPNPPTAEAVEPVASQPQSKMPEPPAKPASENPAPPATATEPISETASASVEKPGSEPVAVPAPFEPARDASQTREKVVANPSFVERLMGFKPGERIAPIQPGRRATQPHFIRQLENVDAPAEHAGGAGAETN